MCVCGKGTENKAYFRPKRNFQMCRGAIMVNVKWFYFENIIPLCDSLEGGALLDANLKGPKLN
jgi:hypothetical protein